MNISENQLNAADEFTKKVFELFLDDKGIHVETTISAIARMSGTFLFRTFDFQDIDPAPGSVLLSEEANEKGPILIQILGISLANMGINIQQSADLDDIQNNVLMPFLESQQLLEKELIPVKDKYNLSFEEAAYSASISTAIIIKECEEVINPELTFNLAIYSFIEGCKTVPVPFKL